jgi:hypothetical protein
MSFKMPSLLMAKKQGIATEYTKKKLTSKSPPASDIEDSNQQMVLTAVDY